MKIWHWGALVAIVTFVIVTVVQPPTWFLLLVLLPLFAVGFTIVSFTYSFRQNLTAEAVPSHGCDNRIRDLKRMTPELERLGFSPVDEFFLRTIPDCLVHGYLHRTEPAYFCLYHFGSKITVDIVSICDRDISLTTSDTADSGNVPRPPQKALQIFPGLGYPALWQKHLSAMHFLSGLGVAPRRLTAGELRPLLMSSLKEFKEHVRSMFLWPVKLIFWVVTRYGKRYCHPLEVQWRQGIPHAR